MAGCSTDWTTEKKPGGGWLYNNPEITYNEDTFDGLTVYYNSLGLATSWIWEDPIDGCNDADVPVTFMDGTTYTFMDGTSYEYN